MGIWICDGKRGKGTLILLCATQEENCWNIGGARPLSVKTQAQGGGWSHPAQLLLLPETHLWVLGIWSCAWVPDQYANQTVVLFGWTKWGEIHAQYSYKLPPCTTFIFYSFNWIGKILYSCSCIGSRIRSLLVLKSVIPPAQNAHSALCIIIHWGKYFTS